ncbi:MAG: putative sulfate exporter family transporter [Rickettsiales bacterium]|nr:putative sulfate exporter family transporter [Rickettsiales bacterium]
MPSVLKKILFILAALVVLQPAVNATLALLIGLIIAFTFGNPYLAESKKYTSLLLQVAIVGLGADMNLHVIAQVGLHGIGYTAATIIATMLLGLLIGKWLSISANTSILISAGTAICGGSAIAAVGGAITAKSEEMTIALATVFCLNAAALFIFPYLGHLMSFDQQQFGLWSALAVHDTSSVVGTSLQYGEIALQTGTTVKLVRALWIIPLTFAVAFFVHSRNGGEKQKMKWPWFILYFLVAAALVTYVPQLQETGHKIAFIARRLLVLTLFFIGANLTEQTIKAVGYKPFIQGISLWIIVASTTALLIKIGILGL